MPPCPPHALDSVTAFDGKLRLTAVRARLFDRFLYDGTFNGRAVLVHEFAPQGMARRTKGGSAVSAEERFDTTYVQAREAFQAAMAAAHPHLLVAVAAKGNWVVSDAPGRRLVDEPGEAQRDLAAALKSVVEAGLVLGTICPDTVFRREGRVVFAGRAPDYRDLIDLAGSSDMAGPAGYAAPEVYDGKKRAAIGHEADMFAASALMFRLAGGRDPVDLRSGDLGADVVGASDAVRAGLTLSRKARAEAMKGWFDGFKPVAAAAPKPAPAAEAPLKIDHAAPVAVKARKIPVTVWVIGAVVAIPFAILALTVGLDSWKQAATERQTREAREAVERCRTAVGQSAGNAASQCARALAKLPDAQAPDYSWVAYNLGRMCETKAGCAQGKSALDYYRLAAGDRTSTQGKIANYKVARMDDSLSLAERHDHYAPAAGVLKKPDTAFIKANRAVYADANFQIGQIFDTWSRQESFDADETQRLSPGSSRPPQKIALISAINRFEVAKTYGVDTGGRLIDLYIRRGDSDAEAAQYDSAIAAYKRAGALGSADGQFKAAEIYFAGNSNDIDQDEAVALVNSASQGGNTDAELCLAAMHLFGYPYQADPIGGMASFAALTVRGVHNARLDDLACRDWIRRNNS